MKWSKSPPELIAAFDAALPGPPVERKMMFGYPAGFVNGNMFCGLWQDSLVLRLDEKSREKIKGRPFEPMPGRPMKEYVIAPKAIVGDEDQLTKWMETAVTFVSKMPPKKKKAAAKKKK